MRPHPWFLLPVRIVPIPPAGCDRSPMPAHGQRVVSPALLRIDGSTTLHPAFVDLADAHRRRNPGVEMSLRCAGTVTGINRLMGGEIDLATTSRDLRQSEIEQAGNAGISIRTFLIGYDAIGIILHPERHKVVRQLTREQARRIFFDGTINNRSQLDASLSGTIQVYTRDPTASGTASAFNELVAGSESVPCVTRTHVVAESVDLVKVIAQDVEGIGYASSAHLGTTVGATAYRSRDEGRQAALLTGGCQ